MIDVLIDEHEKLHYAMQTYIYCVIMYKTDHMYMWYIQVGGNYSFVKLEYSTTYIIISNNNHHS